MKFQIQKRFLLDGFEKVFPIATKGVKSEFEMAGRVTLCVEGDKLVFLASNGHLLGHYTAGPVGGEVIKGSVTVDVNVGRSVAKNLGAADSTIEVERKDDTLFLTDVTARNNSRTRKVKLSVLSKDHEFSVSKPQKNGIFSHQFDTNTLTKSFKLVGKYKCPLQFKAKYLMTCLHFLPDKTHYVCGDGLRFATLVQPEPNPRPDIANQVHKYLIPVEQSLIVSSVIEDTQKTTFIWKNPQEIYIEAGNVKMMLVGIPKEEYISYEVHAFRQDEAKVKIDIPRTEFLSLVNITNSVRDKTQEEEGKFHSVDFTASSAGLKLECKEGQYQCEADAACDYYNLANKEVFKSAYCWDFLNDVVVATSRNNIRFYCINEEGIMLAEPCNTNTDKKDGDGVPELALTEDNSRLVFFFAAATEDDE